MALNPERVSVISDPSRGRCHAPNLHRSLDNDWWNCKHIANAEMQTAVNRICRSAGYEPPVICTPEELSGD